MALKMFFLVFAFFSLSIPSNGLAQQYLLPEEYLHQLFAFPGAFNTSHFPATPSLFQSAIALYQECSSNRHCVFLPSCSRYSYLCFETMNPHRALLQTMNRFYRCNTSAFGSYPIVSGLLYDPPVTLMMPPAVPLDSDYCVQGDGKPSDYGTWLMMNSEWDSAYTYYLERLFLEDGREYRLRAAVAALNLNRLDAVRRWLAADTSIAARGILALSCYRSGRFNESASLSQGIVELKGNSDWQRRAAVTYLASCLCMRMKPDITVSAEAASVLVPANEVEPFLEEYNRACGSPPAVPYAIASTIPGLGQALNGYTSDAFIAFTFCSLLGLGAWSSFDNDNVAGGIFFSAMFLYAYAANIQSGKASAARRAFDRSKAVRDRLYLRFNPTASFVEVD